MNGVNLDNEDSSHISPFLLLSKNSALSICELGNNMSFLVSFAVSRNTLHTCLAGADEGTTIN